MKNLMLSKKVLDASPATWDFMEKDKLFISYEPFKGKTAEPIRKHFTSKLSFLLLGRFQVNRNERIHPISLRFISMNGLQNFYKKTIQAQKHPLMKERGKYYISLSMDGNIKEQSQPVEGFTFLHTKKIVITSPILFQLQNSTRRLHSKLLISAKRPMNTISMKWMDNETKRRTMKVEGYPTFVYSRQNRIPRESCII